MAAVILTLPGLPSPGCTWGSPRGPPPLPWGGRRASAWGEHGAASLLPPGVGRDFFPTSPRTVANKESWWLIFCPPGGELSSAANPAPQIL